MSQRGHSAARRGWGWQGWTLSIGVHGLLLAWLLWGEPPPRPSSADRSPVKVSLVTRRAPPAPAVQEPIVAPKPAEEATVQRARPKQQRVVKAKAPIRPKAPSQEQTPPLQEQPATPPPPRFAVSLEATVPGGGVALPAVSGGSGSAFSAPRSQGETRRGGRGNSGDSDAAAPRPVQSGDPGVTTLPRLLSKPSAQQLQAAYPTSAREQGLEGDVQLKILVSASGKVTEVRVLRKAGNGFDEVAKRLVRTFRFSAGRKGSQPVAVWIPWTYKFRLNG